MKAQARESTEVGSVGDSDGRRRASLQFQEEQFVGGVGAEEGAGEIEGALRPCVPETPEVEPVHPDIPFREPVEAHEAIRFARNGKFPFEEFGELCRAARPIQPVEVIERKASDVEVHQGLIVEHEG